MCCTSVANTNTMRCALHEVGLGSFKDWNQLVLMVKNMHCMLKFGNLLNVINIGLSMIGIGWILVMNLWLIYCLMVAHGVGSDVQESQLQASFVIFKNIVTYSKTCFRGLGYPNPIEHVWALAKWKSIEHLTLVKGMLQLWERVQASFHFIGLDQCQRFYHSMTNHIQVVFSSKRRWRIYWSTSKCGL